MFRHRLGFTEKIFLQIYDSYYLGVTMAVTACVAQGVTCVMVAKVRAVVTPVLTNWASIMGLVMGVLYWLIEDRNTGLSLEDETPLNWALITGESSILQTCN